MPFGTLWHFERRRNSQDCAFNTTLARYPSLFVVARNSSFAYKGKSRDIRVVGRDLGVRYVLEGSVRRSGQKVRITGQLIETDTGRHLWAEKYDCTLDDEPTFRVSEWDK